MFQAVAIRQQFEELVEEPFVDGISGKEWRERVNRQLNTELEAALKDNDSDKELDLLRQLAYCQVLEREGYWTGLARVPDMTSRGMTMFSSSTKVDEGFWFRSVVVSQSCVPEPMFEAEMQGQTPEWNCAKSLLDSKIL